MLRSMLHAWLALPLLAFALQSPGDVATTPVVPVKAQQIAQPDIADAAETASALLDIKERMTVPVKVDGAGPYHFVIDTGSERSVIARELADRLKLAARGPVNVMAMSGRRSVATVLIPSMRISAVPPHSEIVAPALAAVNLGGPGLLGLDVLGSHTVTIDFDAQTMNVEQSVKRKKGRERLAPGEIVVHAKSAFGQLIVTDAEFEGRKIRVVIDTGSPVSVGNLALWRMVRRNSRDAHPMDMISAVGGIIKTNYALVDNVRIGDAVFDGMPIAFVDAPPFASFGLENKPAMMLGMNALKFFRRVRIDFANREVRFLFPDRDKLTHRCVIAVGQQCVA